MDKSNKKKYFINIAIILIMAIFFISDRFLKWLAINNIFENNLPIFKNFFYLTFNPNHKIAFSLPLQGLGLNILITIIVLGLLFLIIYLIKKKYNQLIILLLSAIFLGAASNLLDRLTLNYVIDYFYLKNFTIFNLADAMISISAIILVFLNQKITTNYSTKNK